MQKTINAAHHVGGLKEITAIPEALLSIRKVLAIRGIGRSRHYEDVAAGRYPSPVKLSLRCARWPAGEVLEMARASIAGQPEEEIRQLVRRLEAARVNTREG